MKPGRELDKLIAEKIFGIKVIVDWPDFSLVPSYSTDIAAAWSVVEKLDLLSTNYLKRDGPSPISDQCWAVFQDGGNGAISYDCESAPHAICLAALKAVGAL